MVKNTLAIFLLAAIASVTQTDGATYDSRMTADYWVGLEAVSGEMQYEIGGTIKQNGIVDETYFPISRLEWPISLIGIQFGGRLGWNDWDARASVSVAQNDDAGTMKDSDWEIPDDPDVLTTYSESDVELQMWQVEASLRYWVPFRTSNAKEQARLGSGAGVLYQDFDWSAHDTVQWYPQNPALGRDLFPGEVITYEAQVLMPFFEVGGQLRYDRLFFEGRLGLAPWVQIEDVDDHKLRYIRAETTSSGSGAFAELLARYTLADHLFVQVSLWGMALETDGTEKDYVYDGEDAGARWEIDHEVKSVQTRFTLAGGITF